MVTTHVPESVWVLGISRHKSGNRQINNKTTHQPCPSNKKGPYQYLLQSKQKYLLFNSTFPR